VCFSANASFAASGVTAIAGATALGGSRTHAHRLVAAIPIFFALHQFAEAIVWLELEGKIDPTWQAPAMFFFLVVAKVIWPTWVPMATRAVEEPGRRRTILTALLGLGVLESLAQVYALSTYDVSANIAGGHIAYHVETPPILRWVVDVGYVLVTAIPPLFSSHRMMRVLGVGVLASLIVAKVAFSDSAASVWCFFAAFMSLIIVAMVRSRAAKAGPAKTGTAQA